MEAGRRPDLAGPGESTCYRPGPRRSSTLSTSATGMETKLQHTSITSTVMRPWSPIDARCYRILMNIAGASLEPAGPAELARGPRACWHAGPQRGSGA
jgi:hypothetical protein